MKAFPTKNCSSTPAWLDNSGNQGMDLRDYFAAKATETDIENYQWKKTVGYGIVGGTQVMTREQAKFAYADAMIKARNDS